MKRYLTMSPEGTRDYLFEESRARTHVEQTLANVFSSRAFCRVVTPTLEYFDLFSADCVGFSAEEVYKLVDRKGRILALRADSTAPIARLTATKLRDEALPIRLYYSQPVFKVSPQHSAQYDEVMQCGVELIGAPAQNSDLEILALAASTLRSFSAKFRLEIGHIGFFQAVMDDFPIDGETKEEIRRLAERKDFAVLYERLRDYRAYPAYEVLTQLPRLFGGAEVLERARGLITSERGRAVLDYISGVYAALQQIHPDDDVMIDLGLVHRNDYYTGILVRGYIENMGEAVLSGGRYDTLLANFGAPLEAIGFGVNVDLLTRHVLSAAHSPRVRADLLVAATAPQTARALRWAEQQAAAGLVVESAVLPDRAAALRYAEDRGIGRVEFFGADSPTEKG